MKRLLITVLLVISITLSTQASEPAVIEAARGETVAWLSLADSGLYESSWDSASALFRAAISKEDWVRSLSVVRSPIGALESRKMAVAEFDATLPAAPDGEYVVFQFKSSFEHKASALETVTAMKGVDGVWRVAGYFIK